MRLRTPQKIINKLLTRFFLLLIWVSLRLSHSFISNLLLSLASYTTISDCQIRVSGLRMGMWLDRAIREVSWKMVCGIEEINIWETTSKDLSFKWKHLFLLPILFRHGLRHFPLLSLTTPLFSSAIKKFPLTLPSSVALGLAPATSSIPVPNSVLHAQVLRPSSTCFKNPMTGLFLIKL